MNATLYASIGASTFKIDWQRIGEWAPALDCADWLALAQNGTERIRVDLSDGQRWVAFRRNVNGSALACIGYQETVGATYRGPMTIGGSNRKFLAWLHPSGRVYIGEQPGD